MAGFVTWLRRQAERDDLVGVLSRDFIQDDPERDVWTLEGLRERMIVRGACRGRYDALAQAVVEWGAVLGIAVSTRTEDGQNILAPAVGATEDAARTSADALIPWQVKASGGHTVSQKPISAVPASHGGQQSQPLDL